MDGIQWTAHSPLNVTWDGVAPQGIEGSGFERLELTSSGGGKYYFLIGGGAAARSRSSYSMWVFRSEHVDGPNAPVTHRFRLSVGAAPARFHSPFEFGALAAWCRVVGRS